MNSEAKLISAVCKNKDISTLLSDNADMLFVTHGDVWAEVKKQWAKYKAVPDASILEDKFRDFDAVEVNGATEFFLDELRDDYVKNKLRNLIVSKGRKLDEVPAAQVLEELTGELSGLGKLTTVVRDLDVTDIDTASSHFEAVKERSKAMGGSPGIPTGIVPLDVSYPTGLAPGHFVVVIGWSGRGKSWFSNLLACKAWEQGFKPMIVSLEMSPEDIRERVYTIMGSGLFKNTDLVRGDINIDQFKQWGRTKFNDRPGFVIVSSEDSYSVTPSHIQTKVDQYRPDLVILDYLQLFDDNGHSNREVEKMRNISRECKLMAVHNALPVVALSQATQDDVSDTDSPPLIEQVAWSKGIQHDADLALAVHHHGNNFVECITRKNRHGPEAAFAMDWNINEGVIKELYDD